MYIHSAQKIRKFGQKVGTMYDQLNGPFGNRTDLDKVFSNFLSACISDYTLILQEFQKNMEVQILAGNY